MDNSDWAKDLPKSAAKPKGPYEDYGWEAGESIMPEFRDPSVHVMPYEEKQMAMDRVRDNVRNFMSTPRGRTITSLAGLAIVAAIVAGVVLSRRMS